MKRLLVLVLLLLPASPASAAAPPKQAHWAVSWLAARVTQGGYVANPDGSGNPGATVMVGLALAAGGGDARKLDAIAKWLPAHIDAYARSGDADRPGALGRLAMLAAATGRDPNAFGGTAPANRLVDRILATRTLAGPYAGMLADPSYGGLFNHSLGLLGVATARSLTADQRAALASALDFTVAQQCDDGGWQNAPRIVLAGIALTACSSQDTNAASLAAQALAAHKRAARIDPLGWFAAAANTAGGYGYFPGGATDADSTALAVQAVLAWRGNPARAYAALLTLQICAGPAADRGAFAYMKVADGPSLLATTEAVPAVARRPFPLPRHAAPAAKAPVPCR